MAVKDRGSVYSMRFSEKDLALLKSLAERQGLSMSDLIREALTSLAATPSEPTVEIDTPRESKVFVYHGGPAQSVTRGATPSIMPAVAAVLTI